MRGKPQRARMELMPQHTSLTITSSHAADAIPSAIKQDLIRQVTQENHQAQHLQPQALDSTNRFLSAIGLFIR